MEIDSNQGKNIELKLVPWVISEGKEKSIKAGTLKKVGRKYVWRSKKSEQNFRKTVSSLNPRTMGIDLRYKF